MATARVWRRGARECSWLGCALVSAAVVLVGLDVTSEDSWLSTGIGWAVDHSMALLGNAGVWVYAHDRLLAGLAGFACLFLWCCALKESASGNPETRFWQGFGVAVVGGGVFRVRPSVGH